MDRMQIDMVLSQQSTTRIERIVEVEKIVEDVGPQKIVVYIFYVP